MKAKRIENTAALSAAAGSPLEGEARTASADSVKSTEANTAPAIHIPADITEPAARRAYALAFRRTAAGRKLDYMPPRLIPALCRGIAAAFWLMQKAGQTIETATAARN